MPNPVHSRHWASQVDATLREYIDARIHEELKPIRDDIAALYSAISVTRDSFNRDMGNVAGRISNTEDVLSMSAARVARLAALAKEKDE